MCAINVPRTVIKAIDCRHRAFFWTGEDVCHGSKCLIAWDTIQASKNNGGLGVKDLELQNRCLLMKFINKLFSNELASWKDWILWEVASFDTPPTRSSSYLWRIIIDELNSYRSIPMSTSTMVRPPPFGSTTGSLTALFVALTLLCSPTLLGLTYQCNVPFKKSLI
jgi:hypothetical protein